MQLHEIKEIFERETRHIWGDKVADFIEMKYVIKPQKPGMSISCLPSQLPKAYGDHLLCAGKNYTLYIAPQTLNQPYDYLLALIRHEVIHIGHMKHTKDFFKVCKKYNAMLTIDSYHKKHLPPYRAQIQTKKGARYKTIRRFNDEDEAYEWLKQYCHEHNIEKGRIKL